MLRKLIVAGTAVAALSALTFISPVAAGSCAVVTEKAIGLKQTDTSTRAMKQLKHKINHWAKKNGNKSVRVGKVTTTCSKKGALYHCTSSAKACG